MDALSGARRGTVVSAVRGRDGSAVAIAAAEDLKVPYLEMLSQAGHDAYNMTRICPTAMIFAPCDKGISHNEAEHMAPEDAFPGVNVLMHAVLARANR